MTSSRVSEPRYAGARALLHGDIRKLGIFVDSAIDRLAWLNGYIVVTKVAKEFIDASG
jgi:hypothetical protein